MFQKNKNLIVIVHILVLWLFAVNMIYAQEGSNAGFNLEEHQDKSSYREVVRLLFRKEYGKVYPEYGMSTLNKKKSYGRSLL